MGTIERRQRLKDETRINILDAALRIVKEEGWEALSLRKIADAIEYTAPIIYDYFENKKAILLELTRIGFLKLERLLQKVIDKGHSSGEVIIQMWLAYWSFAFEEIDLYKLMFGVDTHCANDQFKIPESELPTYLFKTAIKILYGNRLPDEQVVTAKYYTYWSVVHGLIAINMVNKGSSETVNKQILIDSIKAINKSIVH
jgi:AcrR family transcriptional regulator